MRQFVPITDDLLYRADGPPGILVPYRTGVECWHGLSAAAPPRPDSARNAAAAGAAQRCTVSVSPGFTPSFSATPALSSSTYCAGPLEG